MKVLAIGEQGVVDFVKDMYPEGVVERVALRPRNMHKDYDALVSYMVLPDVEFNKTSEIVKSWVDTLKQGGEFVLFCPSLEWAAYQILSPQRSPVLLRHLFGKKHRSGFTMLDLRTILSKAGIAVTHAQTGEYTIGEYSCECHILRGVKK